MFQLIETIKIIDGVPQNLFWHQNRLEDSYFKLYGKKTTFDLADIITIPERFSKGIVKLRILYSNDSFKCEYSFYKQKTLRLLKLVFDDNINYPLKYTNRSLLNQLLMQKDEYDDILIVKNGFITDSSYTNIVFNDGNNWITPDTPLLQGTARKRLIEEGIIIEKKIQTKDLTKFKSFKLINAMLDFHTQEELDIKNITH